MHKQLLRRRYMAAAIGAVALTGLSARDASAVEGLTLDLRVQGTGLKTATTTAGGVVSLDVYAKVAGTDAVGANGGIQEVYASFLSNTAGGGTLAGNLASLSLSSPYFTAGGSSLGTQQDLNADSNA